MNKHYTFQEYLEKFNSIQDSYEFYFEIQKEIDKLQSKWNSLREWLEVNDRYSQGYFKQTLEYMNKLEGKDNN